MKKLLIFTDTYASQVNGVTRCIENLTANLSQEIEIHIISSDDFFTIPFFGYTDIHFSLTYPHHIYKLIQQIRPDYIHIMTEGPIGLMAAYLCRENNIPYTTTFHTKFPEYLNMRNRFILKEYVHIYLRYIHGGAKKIFISNEGLRNYLQENKYQRIQFIPFGIDHGIFFSGKKTLFQGLKSPILLFVGRIAIEKNIDDFLNIENTYIKIIAGDGPLLKKYKKDFPQVLFIGNKTAQELGEVYRSVDIFIFPSKTDTLGLVNLEAMASGLPVIAYDTENTRGIIQDGKTGILVMEGESLESGISRVHIIKKSDILSVTKHLTWKKYAKKFVRHQSLISKNVWI